MELTPESSTLISIIFDFSKPAITISTSWWLFLAFVVLLIVLYVLNKKFRKPAHKITKSKFIIKTVVFSYESEIERNYQNLFIANRIYIELVTRKAALDIDVEHDLIIEIYDSWYKLFGIIRDEIKSIPGHNLVDGKSNELIQLTTKILNDGIRPHLTTYQAKFRKWYNSAIQDDDNKQKSPQDIQKLYSNYDSLIDSMKDVNQVLKEFSSQLKIMIEGNHA